MEISRPQFQSTMQAKEFRRWYWLKAELVVACRLLSVSTVGSKPELEARICAALDGIDLPVPQPRRIKGDMPTRFTLDTRIAPGWRCNPLLGAFLRQHAGARFRFNAAVREFVHTRVGEPISAIIECYRASVAAGAPRAELPPQLEYNRHMQAFARERPGAPRSEMLAAWEARKARPSK
jgi:hypothetical protein